MSRPQKIFAAVLWALAVGGMICLVAMKTIPSANGPATTQPDSGENVATVISPPAEQNGGAPPVLYPAPQFTLVNQDGKLVSEKQLAGHPWVADFIFTTCASLCPTMSAEMERLQQELPPDVRLVSFSVDPKNDTPPVLKAYAQEYHAEPGKWIFLTGDEQTQERVVRAMKLGFAPAANGAPIQHDEHFVLIDGQGRIRGFYDSVVKTQMDDLLRDAQYLSDNSGGAGQ